MQKNVSLRSRQVKNFASAGTRIWDYGVTIAEFIARGPERVRNSQSLVSGLVVRVCSRVNDKVGGSHILRVWQSFFEFQLGSFFLIPSCLPIMPPDTIQVTGMLGYYWGPNGSLVQGNRHDQGHDLLATFELPAL
jgi:hypothetical protein